MANEISVDVIINGLDQNTISIKNLTDALNGLAKPSKDTQENLKKTEDALTNLTNKGFGKLASVAVASIGTVAALFAGREIIQAAIEQENSINDLNVTLQSLGIYSKETSQELQDFADQLQQTTKYSDDQVISSLNLIGAMTTLDKDGLKKATQASLDLASTFKLDVETASRIVGKGIEGNTERFKGFGIEVKKGATESENLANILQALSRQQGRSQAELQTFGGALAFLKNGFGELLASIGDVIIKDPLITKMITNIGEGFFKLADFVKGLGVSLTGTIIKILDVLGNWGVTFESIAYSTIIPAVIAIGVAFASQFNAIAFASGVASAALITFQTVITGGLYLALAGMIAYFIKLRDEAGSWSGLFEGMATQIAIWAKTAQLKFTEVGLYFSELRNKLIGGFLDLNDSFNKLLGIKAPKIEVDTKNVDEYKNKINQLNLQIDSLVGNIARIGDEGEKQKGKDFFSEQKNSLIKLQEELKKTQSSLFSSGGGKVTSKSFVDTEQIKKDFESLYKDLQGLDQGETGRIEAEFKRREETIQKYISKFGDAEGKGAEALLALYTDTESKRAAIEKKSQEERLKARQEEVNRIKANPIGDLVGFNKKITEQIDLVITPKIQGLVEGFGEAFAKGKEGAKNLLVSATSGAIDTILPGVGSAIKPFLDVFAQGPEATQKMVEEFLGAVPTFVSNLIRSVPAFIGTIVKEVPKIINQMVEEIPKVILEFANQIPTIIFSFIESIPSIVTSLVDRLPILINELAAQMPFIAFELITSIVKNIPYLVGQIAVALYNAVVNMFNQLNPFGDDNVFGFAEGGKIVKGGIAGKDSVPARVMPGELIVDRSLTQQMQDFFDNTNSGGANNDVTNALLANVIDLLSRPQEINTSVQVNNRTLAEIMINLNRINARTTA